MSNTSKLVIAPNLTPFNLDYTVDMALFVEHAQRLLAEGCSALAPFGTTGEANSLGISERMQMLETMLKAGIPPSKIIPGTGLCALPDSALLCRHAAELQCAGVLTLPPFFYKDVSDEGLFGYFARLIESIRNEKLKIYLYHIPQVSKVGLSVPLVKRLHEEFSGTVVGIKDSSGDWENTARLLAELPTSQVFPGSELQLLRAIGAGAIGCITATANVNARAIRELADNRHDVGAVALEICVDRYRKTIQPYGPIPAMKALLALEYNHEAWARVRHPLSELEPTKAAVLAAELSAIPFT